MKDEKAATFHASPERKPKAELQRQVNYFRKSRLLRKAWNSVNVLLLVINDCRQVVYVNQAFLKRLGKENQQELLGRRPGEIIGCPHSEKEPGGCGTSRACRDCAAVNLLLEAIRSNREHSGEVALTGTRDGEEVAFQFQMKVAPIRSDVARFFVVSMIDASDHARRRVLERFFFHDVLNTAGGLKGLLELIHGEVEGELKEYVGMAANAFRGLAEEIQAQKQLRDAEENELRVSREAFSAREMLEEVAVLYEWHEVSRGKQIRLEEDGRQRICFSDRKLLRRVLGNMLKNALEATEAGGTVRLGCRTVSEAELEYYVHNDSVMPPECRHRISQRSFSTKGRDRGIGTYSMKLLGEKYLRGKVGFLSEDALGTTFFLRIPDCGLAPEPCSGGQGEGEGWKCGR